MWFLVHVSDMNGRNTRGLLGKGLSPPGTPCSVQSIHTRDMYMLTQLRNHVSKEQYSRGEYMTMWGPGWRQSIDGGLFGALNGAVAWTGAGAIVEKENALPRASERGGARN